MDKNESLHQLSSKAWEFRKSSGFLKMLPEDIRIEAAALARGGTPLPMLAKALGVGRNTIMDWRNKYSNSQSSLKFSEVQVVDERPAFEVKLIGQVQSVRVELTGTDYSLLQRLLRKLGS